MSSLDEAGPLEAAFDQNVALARVEGDTELLREIVALFSDEAPRLLSEIRESITHCDSKALERAAHSLKGSVGSFGAQGAFDAALRLEDHLVRRWDRDGGTNLGSSRTNPFRAPRPGERDPKDRSAEVLANMERLQLDGVIALGGGRHSGRSTQAVPAGGQDRGHP